MIKAETHLGMFLAETHLGMTKVKTAWLPGTSCLPPCIPQGLPHLTAPTGPLPSPLYNRPTPASFPYLGQDLYRAPALLWPSPSSSSYPPPPLSTTGQRQSAPPTKAALLPTPGNPPSSSSYLPIHSSLYSRPTPAGSPYLDQGLQLRVPRRQLLRDHPGLRPRLQAGQRQSAPPTKAESWVRPRPRCTGV